LNKTAKRQSTDGPSVLAGGAGTYQERPVIPELREHFVRVWFHCVPRGAPGRSVIVPDGCADLVWCNGSLILAGPDPRVKIELVPAGTTVVGLQFQPGSASQWLRSPVSAIVAARVSLDDLWGAEARHLAERLSDTEDLNDLALRLEVALIDRLPKIASVDRLSRAIFHAIGSRHDYSVPVTQQLQDVFGLSERTLRRRCCDEFGYGPKTLDRILRFQRFLKLARASGIGGTSGLAADAGYSDQSHLTREAQVLAGLTPHSIRKQLTAR
jgi:AraC-like DNA-binding protein